MRHTLTFVLVITAAVSFIFAHDAEVLAAETSVSHEFAPVEWNFGGEPVPETYWTPWLPLGTQQLTRFKFGVRASMGAIAVKCPVKVTFTYDPAKVKSGGDVPVKVKIDMLEPAGDAKTFESAFGISLPNKLQIGFFGISGVPDLLPWIDVPYNLWEAIGKIPKYGSYIESAVQNIGVNTSSDEALPLGSVKAYHDERTLFSFDLSDLAGKYKNDIAVSLYNKISDTLGPYGMGELLTMIQLSKGISEDGAREWLTDLCGDAVAKLGEFSSIELMGDPSFSVEGVGVRLNFRAYVTGGKGSGDYVMTFNRSGQEQTFTFRDITPFIEDGDKLVIIVDSIGYDFKLKQKLVAKIKVAIAPIPIDSVEKTVAWTCPTRKFTESDFKIELPVTKSTDIIQSMRVSPGTTSAMVSWTSPEVPLKGTVAVYNASNTKIKEISESTYKNAHNVVITDLLPTTSYRFVVECLNTSGEKISAGELSTTTTATTSARQEVLVSNTLQITDTGTATAGTNYIDFQWTTNNNSSTEVIMSPSPDLAAASFPVMKKTGGTIQGWGARGGNRVYDANHVIRATELEPGTKYYYLLRSIMFEDNDETKSFDMVGHLGDVTTLPLPPPPSIKIKAQFGSNPLAQIPVVVKKTNGTSFRLVVNTGPDGFTPSINLDKGGRYTFSVENNLYFQDITSSPLDVSASATGEQSPVTLSFTAKPSPGAYVFNAAGQPLSGATVKIRNNTSFTATTDATGLYKFSSLPAAGNIELEVSKTDYATKRVKGRIDSFSGVKLFSADNATLESAIATLTITVKQPSGTALNNVSVKIEEGGAVLATLTTNTQGLATFTHNFGDNNISLHFLTITAEKTASSLTIAPNSATTSIKGGTTQSVDISCLVDNTAPIISGVSLKQTTTYMLVAFTTSELGDYSVEIKDPSGQTSTPVSWSSLSSTTVTGRAIGGPGQGTTGGLCKINIKFRDVAGNETQTGWMDFYFMTSATWNLKATSVNADTALLSWSKYPRPAEFTKYEIVKTTTLNGTGGDAVATITDVNTTTYRVTGLQPNTDYRYLLRAPGAEGLPVKATVNFKTLGLPPVISNFTVTPAIVPLNEDVNIAATISDPDSNIKEYKIILVTDKDKQELKQQKNIAANSVQVLHTLKLTKAGSFKLVLTANDEAGTAAQEIPLTVLSSERPVLKFVKAPSGFVVNKPSVVSLDLTNKTKVSGELEFSIDWGDGKQQNIKAQAQKGKIQIDKIDSEEAQTKTGATEVEHTYGTIGDFTVTVNATLTTEEKVTLTATDPLTAAVTVTAKPTVATLAEDKTKSTDNQKYFNIKATGNSYKVTSWTITYGDDRSDSVYSGTGDVDKQVSHNYTAKGDYTIEFIVTDAGNNEIKKLALVRIRRDAALGTGGSLQQPKSDESQLQQANKTTTTTTTTSRTSQTLQQQATSQTDANQAQAKPKVIPPKIDIKKITVAGEEKAAIPVGLPLTVLVDVNATDDLAGPFAVNMELKKGQEKQTFTQTIEKLKQGANSFKWDLTKEPQAGSYTLSVEISNAELKLKDKLTKTFKVTEKKAEIKQ